MIENESKYLQLWATVSGEFGSDKLNVYFIELERILSKLPHGPLRILEIGVQRGGNLSFLKAICPEGSTIVGIDINQPKGIPEGVIFLKGSSASPEIIEQVSALGNFDLVIEDSSHNQKLVKKNIEAYGKLLRVGGFMMIEDMQYAFLPGWGRGIKGRKSVLRYLVDDLYRDLMFGQSTEKFLVKLNPYSITLEKSSISKIIRLDSQSGSQKIMNYPTYFEILKKNLFLIWESKKPYIVYAFISLMRIFSSKLRNSLK